jgi:N-acetylneuraminic acid mutarotase
MAKFLVCLFFASLSLGSFGQGWQQKAPLSGFERDDAAGFVISGNLYVGTGYTNWFAPLADFYTYNSVLDQWTQLQSMPASAARQYACGFSNTAQALGFVFGGVGDSGYFNDLWMFNPNAAVGWTAKTPLPAEPRAGCACFTVGDTAYVVGGRTDSLSAIDEVWAYSMTHDTWQQKANFPFGGRWRASATALNNQGYLALGKDELDNYPRGLYKYHPYTDTWTVLSSFPNIGRTHTQLAAIPNGLFVVMGSDSLGNFYEDTWRYTLHDGLWTKMSDLQANPRRGGVALILAGVQLFYISGLDSTLNRTYEVFSYQIPQTAIPENFLIPLDIHPNPAHTEINISLPTTGMVRGAELSVYNTIGQVVMQAEIREFATNLPISHLPMGCYTVVLKTKNAVFNGRFIKN